VPKRLLIERHDGTELELDGLLKQSGDLHDETERVIAVFVEQPFKEKPC